ncbi:FecR family protein [Novosphingobium resinovorum]|uniref:FecR family protein n=1 Tax=Novosphingobium resinovorum TaxID=158500 RepID=UPI002ED63BAF|nr:FecR family protein [Novosphingobium resinovorum]
MSDDNDQMDDPELAAAEWVVRLGDGPLDPGSRREFDAWLAASPDHAAAFKHAQAAWGQMGKLGQAPGSLARHSVRASTSAAPVPPRRRRFAPLGAMAASVAIAVGISSAWLGDPITYLRADHRTAIARTGSFTLPDGSRVDLGPSSAIALNYDEQERRVELLSGVAYFTAVPKAQAGGRPFVVEAANGTSQALGTRFQVDRLSDGAAVTVMEHDVAVSAADNARRSRRVVLSPGQKVHYDAAGGLYAATPANPELALAWRQGRLVFDREPLAEVVAELNRYRAGRIMVIGDRLAAEKVSGVFDAKDIDGALDALAAETGARRFSGPLLTALY